MLKKKSEVNYCQDNYGSPKGFTNRRNTKENLFAPKTFNRIR